MDLENRMDILMIKEMIKEWSSMYWGFGIQILAFAVLWSLFL
jgi:hypothetical protein